MEYKNVMDETLFQYEGRILKKDKACYLGYTNSYVRFYAKGGSVRANLISNISEAVNMAGLSVYLDDGEEPVNRIVVDREQGWYELIKLPDDMEHLVTVVKVTEAAMSYVGITALEVIDGELLEREFPTRPELKLEFIGDSITCGYGVLGTPDSQYTLREEDGTFAYGNVAAKLLNARARYVSASGYGAYVEYTGDVDGNVPKLYPYINWFVDRTALYDYKEYVPDVVIINLGTNDSGHIHKTQIQEGFVKAYSDFIRLIKTAYPDTKVLCVCGTLCDIMFPWIEKAIQACQNEGIDGICMRKLPYHNVEEDGMASGHPSRITHEKDGARVAGFIKDILDLR